MDLKINIEDYLSREEIKEMATEEVKSSIRRLFSNEKDAMRLIGNLSYYMVWDEIDKVVPKSRELIQQKTAELIKNKDYDFMVFRRKSDWGTPASLAYQIMEDTVRENKDLINAKVKETIENKDYTQEVWDKFEELSETFIDNIYSIVELGRSSKSANK